MSKIVLGDNVKLDLDVLLRSRLLIQANSGGGKSWCIRRLAEQAFGKIPIIIVDPEGEFASLREKFGFVLVGKGGETPADVRSAALVAHRLLQLKASAVCDIFELNPSTRHLWVKTFLGAMIDAPKELWHPALVIVDEAHTFAPEKGAGESEASEAMISLATKGRKRGFAAIFATQRISKLRKDAAAELHNNLFGKCFIDSDRKRAAEQLGLPSGANSKEFREFSDKMKALPQGIFLAQGIAISTDIVEFKVGTVETTHPDVNTKQAALVAPPAPEAIQHLLPKLADLPKAAEEKAKTEADLRSEIRSLKTQLAQRPKEAADEGTIKRAVDAAVKQREREYEPALKKAQAEVNRMGAAFAAIAKQVAPFQTIPIVSAAERTVAVIPSPASIYRPAQRQQSAIMPTNGDSELTGPERKILNALGELLSIGKEQPSKNMVAAWAGYSPVGGAFGNPIGHLRSKGFIDYPQPGTVTLTESGRASVGSCDPPSQEEIWQRIERTCSGPEQKILRALLDNAGPDEISKETLADKSGYSPIGGAFGNPIGALRTKGLLDYPRPGTVRAAEWLFL